MTDLALKPIEHVTPKQAQQIPFLTFDKYLRESGKFKAMENEKTGSGSSTIYTVPVGYFFYLISAQLNYRTDNTVAPSSAGCSLLINAMPFLMLDPPDILNVSNSISLSPAIPIKLFPGESIKVSGNDAKIYSHGVVSGYEVAIDELKLK